MRLFLASVILALGLTVTPPTAAQSSSSPDVHPEIQKANEQREKIKRREQLLVLFPAGALALTVVLIIITRRRK